MCTEKNVGNFKKCTFRNSATLMRRTKRRKSQDMHFQEFWESCAQNKTSNISEHAVSIILGLLCAEKYSVGNLKTCTFRNCETPIRRTQRRGISKSALSKFLGLRLAEQNVGSLKKCQLCICSEQSTCPSSQHSTCLASQQGTCLGSQQGTYLTSQH